jgi:hypothetical protein
LPLHAEGRCAMEEHATVTCSACERPFDAALPLSRRALAVSRLEFLVEVCPHCAQARSYLRSDYRFAATA